MTTIEKKGKKYDEALEWMRGVYPTLTGAAKEDAKHFFPELKESEDERIRKAIIKSIEEDSSVYEQEVSKEQMLAWLEKQKEEGGYEAIPVESTLEYRLGFKAGKELEKQKEPENTSASVMAPSCWEVEQKATEVKDPFSNANFVRGYESGYADAKREQKPADDKAFEKWLDDWYQGSKEAGGDVVMSEAEFKNWSRGIRNMYQQKPAEWSEEDEIRKESCMLYLANTRDVIEFNQHIVDNARKSGKKEIQKDIDWLKSLKNRGNFTKSNTNFPHWKPSEEQMEALNVLNCHGDLSYVGQQNQLISLYNDLKKLM